MELINDKSKYDKFRCQIKNFNNMQITQFYRNITFAGIHGEKKNLIK